MKKMWAAIAVLIAVGMLIAGCPKANEKPNAKFTPDKNLVFVGGSINFNATASKDPDGSIKNYFWNFGDGNAQDVTTKTAAHQFNTAGVFNATLYTKDDKGDKSKTVTAMVVVAPLPITSATQADTFSNITFSIDNSSLGTRITDYNWNYGDNSAQEKGPMVTHQFRENGSFTVTLTIMYQGQSASSSLTVNIADRPPVANISVGSVAPYYSNKAIEFNGAASGDPDGNITKFFWQFSDQTTDNGSKVTHLFAKPGNYTVTLTVTDNDNGVGTTSLNITVVQDLKLVNVTIVPYKDNNNLSRANITIKFDNPGDAKAAGTVNLTVKAYQADKTTFIDSKFKVFDAPIGGGTQGATATITELLISNIDPNTTQYLVEIAYLGNLIDSGWYHS